MAKGWGLGKGWSDKGLEFRVWRGFGDAIGCERWRGKSPVSGGGATTAVGRGAAKTLRGWKSLGENNHGKKEGQSGHSSK